MAWCSCGGAFDFYPRSPCGERPTTITTICIVSKFLSTLSLRRATEDANNSTNANLHFYPRSPCGERLLNRRFRSVHNAFLSTLSLRRATFYPLKTIIILAFLSTLSLRRATRLWTILYSCPGNFYPRSPCGERRRTKTITTKISHFYPRSPCGERQKAY